MINNGGMVWSGGDTMQDGCIGRWKGFMWNEYDDRRRRRLDQGREANKKRRRSRYDQEKQEHKSYINRS